MGAPFLFVHFFAVIPCHKGQCPQSFMEFVVRILVLILALFLVPAASWADGMPEEGSVRIRPLTNGVWLHVSSHTFEDGSRYTSNGLIVRDRGHLVLVDSAWGDDATATLLDEIEAAIGLKVTMAVATHSHEDRAAGAKVMKVRGIRFYASRATRHLMTTRGKTPPEYELDLKDEPGATTKLGPLEIMYPGTAHTADNLVVWLKRQKLLFGGCAVREATAQNLGYFKEGDPAGWGPAMALVQDHYGSATIVVPGHGKVGDAGLLDHTAALAAQHVAAP